MESNDGNTNTNTKEGWWESYETIVKELTNSTNGNQNQNTKES